MASRCTADVLDGRYRLDGLLGSGGAADVYRGFDLRLERPVAVKMFRSGTGFDVAAEPHGEAVILARLHHPGLVTAYDAGQHGERAFLVMQLIDGSTLKHRIAEGPLPLRETAVLGSGLANALGHAHDANIVHRDVKPSNILLDDARRPYLTDFGISRLLDTTTHTVTGTLTGTAAYLAPEQVLGQPVGRPADVYALGLVLLECLTGRLEYDGTPLEAAIARLHRGPVFPEHLPPELADTVRAMTALDENDRPTARDCARALSDAADVCSPESVPAPLPLPSPRPTGGAAAVREHTHQAPRPGNGQPAAASSAAARGARRRPLAVGAGVALAAVMATGLAISHDASSHGYDPSRARTSSSHPDAARKKDTAASTARARGDGRPTPGRSAAPASRDTDNASDSGGAAPSSSTAPDPARAPGPAPHEDAKKKAPPHHPSGKAKKPAKAEKAPKAPKGRKA
ncbi:protein kinase [Streptomyces sp. NPDC048566]|uniref:serine/threonine-protein kinase n=1 Tax=Streptomyces sp. NPDC048566 TaxID=3365569 RepID=UPI003711E509